MTPKQRRHKHLRFAAVFLPLVAMISVSCSKKIRSGSSKKAKSSKELVLSDIESQIKSLAQHCSISTWGAVKHHTCTDATVEKNLAYIDHKHAPEKLLKQYCPLMAKAPGIIQNTPDQSNDPVQRRQTTQTAIDKSKRSSSVEPSGAAADKRRVDGLLSYIANQVVRLSFRLPEQTSVAPGTVDCLIAELKKRHNQSTDRSLSIAAINITANQPLNKLQSASNQTQTVNHVLEILNSSDNTAAKLAGYQALWAKGRLKVIDEIKDAILSQPDRKLKDAVIYSLSMGKPWSAEEKSKLCTLLESFLDSTKQIENGDIIASAASRQIAARCDNAIDKVLSIGLARANAGKIDNNLVFAVSGIAKRQHSNEKTSVSKTAAQNAPVIDLPTSLESRAVSVLRSASVNESTPSRTRILAFKQLSEIDQLTAKEISSALINSSNNVISAKAKSLLRQTTSAAPSDPTHPTVVELEPASPSVRSHAPAPKPATKP